MLRQGDVLLIPVTRIPTESPAPNKILALGEATGHHHLVINGEVFVGTDGKLFVRSDGATELFHGTESGVKADHDKLVVPAGDYEVRVEEDYTPEGLRRVAD